MSRSPLPLLFLLSTTAACGSGGSHLAGQLVIGGDARGDDCDDMTCPVAVGAELSIGSFRDIPTFRAKAPGDYPVHVSIEGQRATADILLTVE